ncbi:hypothetical protein EDC04DRAFT_2603666 [Pisolithus marmoratus]|nr:hypothetical protein EDC04DRAFT_2603666 [Pisolithus marmoratus]
MAVKLLPYDLASPFTSLDTDVLQMERESTGLHNWGVGKARKAYTPAKLLNLANRYFTRHLFGGNPAWYISLFFPAYALTLHVAWVGLSYEYSGKDKVWNVWLESKVKA